MTSIFGCPLCTTLNVQYGQLKKYVTILQTFNQHYYFLRGFLL